MRMWHWLGGSLFRIEVTAAVVVGGAAFLVHRAWGWEVDVFLISYFAVRTILLARRDEEHFSAYLEAKYPRWYG